MQRVGVQYSRSRFPRVSHHDDAPSAFVDKGSIAQPSGH